MTFNISSTEMENLLSHVLDVISKNICVSESDYATLNQHFNALTSVLENGIDKRFSPILRTQGSIRLGTAVKPVDEIGLDADIICELYNVPTYYTQKDVQEIVGRVLRNDSRYKDLLQEPQGGRRCFTIEYADGTHVDILPCVVDESYRQHMLNLSDKAEDYILSITDKKSIGFSTDSNRDNWGKSNPIGYANRFEQIAKMFETTPKSLYEVRASVEPFPKYEDKTEKLTLQKVVQLLKRHRDMLMGDDEDKPVSILMTTLAEEAYTKSNGGTLYEVFAYIVQHLTDYITYKEGKPVVLNPVLPQENFADKWQEKPRKMQQFQKWHNTLVNDVQDLRNLKGDLLANKLKAMFGTPAVIRAYTTIAKQDHKAVRNGILTMSTATGTWSSSTAGKTVKPHTFYASSAGYKLMPPKPQLPLEVQQKFLENTYPNSRVIKKNNGFDWFMDMTPKADSLTYTVKIEVRKNCIPRVQVVNPMPLAMAPGKKQYEHINHPQHLQYLCLNVRGEWTPDMRISETFVPWASEWLLNYEYWLVTGEWEGGGLHRGVYKE